MFAGEKEAHRPISVSMKIQSDAVFRDFSLAPGRGAILVLLEGPGKWAPKFVIQFTGDIEHIDDTDIL